MPTLTQIEYVLAVDKHRHFGRAADECHVSQPTLSQQIQKLEEELNIVIFDREKKPIVLTHEGLIFVEQARTVIREHRKLIEISKSGTIEPSGPFRLGLIPTLSSYLLPLFLEQLSKKYPKLDIFVHEIQTQDMIQKLRDDQLDAGILATPPYEDGFHNQVLFFEKFFLYLSKDHALLKKQRIRKEDIDENQVWTLQEGHCFRSQVASFCSLDPDQDRSVFSNVHFQGGSLETLKNLVLKTQGYTLIPELMVRSLRSQEIKDHVRPFQDPVPAREISLIFRRDHWKKVLLDSLHEQIQKQLPEDIDVKKKTSFRVLEVC